MADFYFFVKAQVDITKYQSGQALLDRWLQEAEAAEGFQQAGIMQSAWKDASAPVVYAVLRLEADNILQAHATLLEAVKGLPMGQDDAIILEQVSEVRPYGEWRELLRQRARAAART